MFGMGIWEFLMILVLGVLLIGPEQLPKVARTIGKVITQFKRATSDLRDAVGKEMHQFEEMEDIKEFKRSLEEEAHTAGSTARDYLEQEMEKEETSLKEALGESEKHLISVDPGLLTSATASLNRSTQNAKPARADKAPANKRSGATSGTQKKSAAAALTQVTAARPRAAKKAPVTRKKSPGSKAAK